MKILPTPYDCFSQVYYHVIIFFYNAYFIFEDLFGILILPAPCVSESCIKIKIN